jgi:hypothetical protein
VAFKTGYAGWFLWAYVGTFVLFTGLALWWVVDVVRRPADRFPGSWPAPRLRWGLVPAAWLLAIGAQTLAWLLGVVLRAQATAVRFVSAADLGLATFVLLIAMIVVGFAYLLRVAFPHPGRVSHAEPGDPDEEHADQESER